MDARDTVLIVEDSALIAFELSEALRESGLALARPFATYSRALEAIDTLEFTFCVLDLDLGGERLSVFGPGEEGRRLLAILNSKNVPTVIYSGMTGLQPDLKNLHVNIAIVDKLSPAGHVIAALKELGAKANGGIV
jgi:DNA-binding response OmpR family regulator